MTTGTGSPGSPTTTLALLSCLSMASADLSSHISNCEAAHSALLGRSDYGGVTAPQVSGKPLNARSYPANSGTITSNLSGKQHLSTGACTPSAHQPKLDANYVYLQLYTSHLLLFDPRWRGIRYVCRAGPCPEEQICCISHYARRPMLSQPAGWRVLGLAKVIRADVAVFLLDEAGRYRGVRASAGENLLAESVVLAAGADTTALLTRSATANPKVYAGHRRSAAGLITGVPRLNPDEAAAHRRAPTFLHAGGLGQGAVMPPNLDNESNKDRCRIIMGANIAGIYGAPGLSTGRSALQSPRIYHCHLRTDRWPGLRLRTSPARAQERC